MLDRCLLALVLSLGLWCVRVPAQQRDLTTVDVVTLRLQAHTGDAAAQAELGYRYQMGVRGISGNDTQAVDWYRKAADQGNATAEFRLGVMCQTGAGMGGIPNLGNAFTWYRKAADQGNAPAEARLGYMFREGLGVTRNYAQALFWYNKAADKGDPDAEADLAYVYAKGLGVQMDDSKAAGWYQKLADQGWVGGQYNIAFLYQIGKGVPQDVSKARYWYQKAADQRFQPAIDELAKLNASSAPQSVSSVRATAPSTQQSIPSSIDLRTLQEEAQAEDAAAQAELGIRYELGVRGISQDYAQAIIWFRRSAEQGNALAEAHLGQMYQAGLGVAQDLGQAKYWYQKAADQGDSLAVVDLRAMEASAPSPVVPTRAIVPDSAAAQPESTGLASGRFYALVIGIDRYPQPLPALRTAVGDANSIGEELQRQYGFTIAVLTDQRATRENILNRINWYRDHLNNDDNLLIYFAGHGYMDRAADRAYWLPADASSIDSPNRISADDLATEVRVQPARHVLIVSDSCYSGDLMRDVGSIPRPQDAASYSRFLSRMINSRSRTIMASGGDEPVADGGGDNHSVFANALLTALRTSDRSMFTASDLFYSHVQQRVGGSSDQQPRYDVIRNSNHEEGDFVFVRTP